MLRAACTFRKLSRTFKLIVLLLGALQLDYSNATATTFSTAYIAGRASGSPTPNRGRSTITSFHSSSESKNQPEVSITSSVSGYPEWNQNPTALSVLSDKSSMLLIRSFLSDCQGSSKVEYISTTIISTNTIGHASATAVSDLLVVDCWMLWLRPNDNRDQNNASGIILPIVKGPKLDLIRPLPKGKPCMRGLLCWVLTWFSTSGGRGIKKGPPPDIIPPPPPPIPPDSPPPYQLEDPDGGPEEDENKPKSPEDRQTQAQPPPKPRSKTYSSSTSSSFVSSSLSSHTGSYVHYGEVTLIAEPMQSESIDPVVERLLAPTSFTDSYVFMGTTYGNMDMTSLPKGMHMIPIKADKTSTLKIVASTSATESTTKPDSPWLPGIFGHLDNQDQRNKSSTASSSLVSNLTPSIASQNGEEISTSDHKIKVPTTVIESSSSTLTSNSKHGTSARQMEVVHPSNKDTRSPMTDIKPTSSSLDSQSEKNALSRNEKEKTMNTSNEKATSPTISASLPSSRLESTFEQDAFSRDVGLTNTFNGKTASFIPTIRIPITGSYPEPRASALHEKVVNTVDEATKPSIVTITAHSSPLSTDESGLPFIDVKVTHTYLVGYIKECHKQASCSQRDMLLLRRQSDAKYPNPCTDENEISASDAPRTPDDDYSLRDITFLAQDVLNQPVKCKFNADSGLPGGGMLECGSTVGSCKPAHHDDSNPLVCGETKKWVGVGECTIKLGVL